MQVDNVRKWGTAQNWQCCLQKSIAINKIISNVIKKTNSKPIVPHNCLCVFDVYLFGCCPFLTYLRQATCQIIVIQYFVPFGGNIFSPETNCLFSLLKGINGRQIFWDIELWTPKLCFRRSDSQNCFSSASPTKHIVIYHQSYIIKGHFGFTISKYKKEGLSCPQKRRKSFWILMATWQNGSICLLAKISHHLRKAGREVSVGDPASYSRHHLLFAYIGLAWPAPEPTKK